MVVLEGGGGSVVNVGSNQYLQPDYLSPVQTTLDTKKSPLALLAQTCSQIGADSSSMKISLDSNNKKKSETSSKSPPAVSRSPKATTPSTEVKLAFKPYEANVLSHQGQTKCEDQQRPNSKCSNSDSVNKDEVNKNSSANDRVPSRNSSEISVANGVSHAGSVTPGNDNRKTVSPAGSSQRGASPIIRSGMEVLHGHPGYKSGYGMNPLSALCCPPGMEQHTNPAFRPTFAGGFSHHHAAMLAAAAANGYPGAQGNPNTNPYIQYQRIKTPSGGEAVVPVCKDPYCPGCPYSLHTQQMLLGAPCPSGCTQCEHQKYGLAMAASMGSLPPGHPYSSSAAAAAAASAAQMRSPYVCSWITGDSYCGKRFNTSDELFSHLRTHTGNLSDPAAAAAALAQSQTQSLLSSLFPPSHMPRGYPTAPLSPMSAARYHPYGKPGALPPHLAGSPFGSAFSPAAAAALVPYYSPYSMYGQRIGSAAVNQ